MSFFDVSRTNVAPNDTDADPVDNSSVATGTIMMWAGSANSPPAEWLLCDGSEVSRATYANLFNTIGTTFGDGSNPANYGSSLSNSTYDMGFYADANPHIFDTLGLEVGETFTVTGGDTGFSTYVWTCTGITPSIISATATYFGTPVVMPIFTGPAGVILVPEPTMFALPNFNGRSIRGVGQASWTQTNGATGTTTLTLGGVGGGDALRIGANDLPQHKHGVFVGGASASVASGVQQCGTPNVDNGLKTIGGTIANPTLNGTYTNADPPVNVSNSNITVINPFLAINFIIKS